MRRSILVLCLLVTLAGCASEPVAVQAVAWTNGRAMSEELDCMRECLDSADEDCDSCAAQCLKPASGESVASRE